MKDKSNNQLGHENIFDRNYVGIYLSKNIRLFKI